MTTLKAPAKLTLTLRVTGVRPDGYHEIDAEMVSLSLHDTIELNPGDGLRVTGVHAPTHAGDTVNFDDDNLVCQALRAVGTTADVELVKRIPAGAGLGGGSSDAAAILRWAGVSDVSVAVRLGADVPFCVSGGRSRVRGIGEIVEPLAFKAETYTLLTPPVHASTPRVYAAWDQLGGPVGEFHNDLEPAALWAYPELERYRDELWELSGQRPRLAGSGSTWFVPGQFPNVATTVVETIPASPHICIDSLTPSSRDT